jgi:ABC-2 type transport system ATP-binding protein
LLGDPEILVLDEPVNGLDPQGIRWLRRLLRERAASGRTALLSSYVLTEVEQTVDDVVVIHRGRLVRQGAIEDLERLGDRGVSVSTPMPERLATAVERAGGRVAFQNGGGRLEFEGIDAARVSELAPSERILLHELVPAPSPSCGSSPWLVSRREGSGRVRAGGWGRRAGRSRRSCHARL